MCRIDPNKNIMIILKPRYMLQIQDHSAITRKIWKNLRWCCQRFINHTSKIIVMEDQSEKSTPSEIIGGGEFDQDDEANVLDCNGGNYQRIGEI